MTSDPSITWGFSYPPHNVIDYRPTEEESRGLASTHPQSKLWKRTETITLEEVPIDTEPK